MRKWQINTTFPSKTKRIILKNNMWYIRARLLEKYVENHQEW
jgi:hypothetical protein